MEKKIYFAGSIRGGRQDVKLYYKIIEMLKGYGTVLTEFVGNEKVTEDSSTYGGRTDKLIHDSDIAMLSSCDFVVAEVTLPSHGVGYELGRANAMNKQILCLMRQQNEKQLSAMVRGAENGTNFLIKDYSNESEVEGILKEYFASRI